MDGLLLASTIERTPDKRLRVSWAKRTIPLKHSTLFNKAKHSEEWHQSIESTAGALHPSDPKFPTAFLRNHTDVYLRKKSKINQADADLRLAILIEAHPAKDIAVASAAHAMTAKSLRQLLHVELHVAQGSYWGLDTWLQCLIAANDGNPASVTDLEALFARMFLPYATHGVHAASSYLKAFSRALRKASVPNTTALPEFSILLRRAIPDYMTQLEGYRLKCDWITASEATIWLVELNKTSSAGRSSGTPFLEQYLDSQFPTWRMWSQWNPDVLRIARLASLGSARLSTVLDIAALEGPDVITGRENTLRKALFTQYQEVKKWVSYGDLVIHVPDCTKACLATMLERIARGLDAVSTFGPSCDGLFLLFRDLMVTRPITNEGLDLFDAVLAMPTTSGDDCHNAIRRVWVAREHLGGEHILSLQRLLRVFEGPRARKLREIMLQDWLVQGIERCIQECRFVVEKQMTTSSWMQMMLELHKFCTTMKASSYIFPKLNVELKEQLQKWPAVDQMALISQIYVAAQSQTLSIASGAFLQHGCTGSGAPIDDSRTVISSTVPKTKKNGIKHLLEDMIENFCRYKFLEAGTVNETTERTMTAILDVWKKTQGAPVDSDRRVLAMHIARTVDDDDVLRCTCLAETVVEDDPPNPAHFIKDLLDIVLQSSSQLRQAIVSLTRLLATKKAQTQCWKDLLYRWLEQEKDLYVTGTPDLIDYSLQTMKAAEWLSFMHTLGSLFRDLPSCDSIVRTPPPILRPRLLNWTTELSKFSGTLTRLEETSDNLDAVRCILVCGEGLWTKNLLGILSCLKTAESKLVEHLMQTIVGKLSGKAQNAWEVKQCMFDLLSATPETIQACEKIWDAHNGLLDIPAPLSLGSDQATDGSKNSHKASASQHRSSVQAQAFQTSATLKRKMTIPLAVVEVMVAGSIQQEDGVTKQKAAILSLAVFLQIKVHWKTIPTETLIEATSFWEGIEREIMKESERLESLKRALRKRDPRGTTLLLKEHDIRDNSVLEEEVMNLPAKIIDLVEIVGDHEVEMSFPLSANTELQRNAMGVPTSANNVLLRLSQNPDSKEPPQFCTHFDSEVIPDDYIHSQWKCSKDSRAPRECVCVSAAMHTAFVWQLNRAIWSLLNVGNTAIAPLYEGVKGAMQVMGIACVSCLTQHTSKSVHLRRSTPCNLRGCETLWCDLPLEVRLPELRTDIFAVDMMLSSVYAAAMSGRSDLLLNCPFTCETIKTVLNALPSLTIIRDAVNVSAVLKQYHKYAEKLISWACLQFRGYLTTATGLCKVHNLPAGTHQFVLANASPRLESAFVARLPRPSSKTTVLFHGTALVRLPAILSQGLIVCSGTPLQRTGAMHGKGIYMAEEPGHSFSYAVSSLSWRNSGLSNMRLVLGCEVVGAGKRVKPGVHVITDAGSVMVRYVFMFRDVATAPVANHVVPAMASAMSAMRTGAV